MTRRLLVVFTVALAFSGCARMKVSRATKDLQSGDPKVRVAAAKTLGELRAAEALPALHKAAADDAPAVRQAAVEALGQIGSAESVDVILATATTWPKQADAALAAIGKPAEPKLLAALERAKTASDAMPAARALAKIGSTQAAAVMLRRMQSPDVEVRHLACTILGELKARDAVPQLIEKLGDSESRVRIAAASALGSTGDARALDPLLARLRVSNPRKDEKFHSAEPDEEQTAAGTALGSLGAAAVPALIQALDDRDEFVRGAAAAGLGRSGDPRAIPALMKHLGDAGEENSHLNYTIGKALADIGGEAVPAVIAASKSDDQNIRNNAIVALGAMEDPRAVPALLDLLLDESEFLRTNAGFYVAHRSDPRITTRLDEAMEKRELKVIAAAMDYYVAKGKPGSEELLIAALNTMPEDPSFLTSTTAQSLLNSGNAKLEKAARAWAERNGYTVTKEEGSTFGSRWGGGNMAGIPLR